MRVLVSSIFVVMLAFGSYMSAFADDTNNEPVNFDKVFRVDSHP
jgi:hypothetical protein